MKHYFMAIAALTAAALISSCGTDEPDVTETTNTTPSTQSTPLSIINAGERTVNVYTIQEEVAETISITKKGHHEQKPSQATVKILNDVEFQDYLERYYGNSLFEGLQILNPKFYHLADENSYWPYDDELTYTFSNPDTTELSVNVIIDGPEFNKWRQDLYKRANYAGTNASKLEEKVEALDTLNRFNFVIPVGLFSNNDSVDSDNKYLIITPESLTSTIGINVPAGYTHIVDVKKSQLLNGEITSIDPQISFTLPCPIKYGFSVLLSTYNYFLDGYYFNGKFMPSKYYQLAETVRFEPNVTEVKVPEIKINTAEINPDDSGTYFIHMCVRIPTKPDPDFVMSNVFWDEPDIIPSNIRENLKFPTSAPYSKYAFIIGYRIVD